MGREVLEDTADPQPAARGAWPALQLFSLHTCSFKLAWLACTCSFASLPCGCC